MAAILNVKSKYEEDHFSISTDELSSGEAHDGASVQVNSAFETLKIYYFLTALQPHDRPAFLEVRAFKR